VPPDFWDEMCWQPGANKTNQGVTLSVIYMYLSLLIIAWDSQESRGLTRPKLLTEHLDSRNHIVSITIGGSPVAMPVLRQV
jgi:hypothetical protein